MTWGDFFWGLAETVADVLPVGSGIARKSLNAIKRGVGAIKDYQAGGNVDLSDLSTDIGNLKDGLAGAKAQIETQGKELHGKIDGLKSELQGKLQQQGAKFDQEIQNLDAKIASLQGEQKNKPKSKN